VCDLRHELADDYATDAISSRVNVESIWARSRAGWLSIELEWDVTRAIVPWKHSGRAIICSRALALGLALVVGTSAIGQEPPSERPPVIPSEPAEALPPSAGEVADPALPAQPSPFLPESAIEEIANATDAAETADFLETDASSFTFAVRTAEKNRFIFESGYSSIKIGKQSTKDSFPESLFRYGLTDRLELRFGYNYETTPTFRDADEGDIAGNFGINAQQQIYYGFKYQVSLQTKSNPWRPTSSFLFQFHTPIESEESHTQIRLGYALGWRLPNGWLVDTGFRYGTDREHSDDYTLWAPSSVVRIPLDQRKKWFAQFEYFGIVSEFRPKNFSKQFVDTGLHYFITPNWEIGATVSFGINEQTRGTMVNAGTGIQF
jgi:hypothetical protein